MSESINSLAAASSYPFWEEGLEDLQELELELKLEPPAPVITIHSLIRECLENKVNFEKKTPSMTLNRRNTSLSRELSKIPQASKVALETLKNASLKKLEGTPSLKLKLVKKPKKIKIIRRKKIELNNQVEKFYKILPKNTDQKI